METKRGELLWPRLVLVIVLSSACVVSCTSESGDSEGAGDADADTDADSDYDYGADADVDADADADADADTDTDSDYDYGADADVDVDADTDTDVDADADADTDADTDTETDPGNEGDQYEDPGTNPFVDTTHDPFSTFAADVDTASYDIFRRDIQYGRLPRKESVRLEEYVNYFAYEYPAPSVDDEHPFSIDLAAAPDICGNGTNLLRVGIQGMVPPAEDKKPANLVFLIDRSGSMDYSNKLPLVQLVLTLTLDILDPTDRVALVAYAGQTGVILESTPVSEKQRIKDAINSLNAGGSTAGAAGIDLAYEQAEANFIPDGINHVLLCTDGDFNVGVSSTAALVDLIKEKRSMGITLTVLGFGSGNLNDAMMEQITNAGDGTYAMISSEAQARDYVEHRMLSNIIMIAKDMKIQVEFNPELVAAYRLLGYENRAVADEDFRDDRVDGGEVGAGHRVTALYELVMAGGSVPERDDAPEVTSGEPVDGAREIAPEDLVLVKVRYKDPGATDDDAAYEVSATMTPAEISAHITDVGVDFQWAVAIAAFAELLKQSPYANLEALGSIAGLVSSEQWLDPDRQEFVGLFATARGLLEE